MKTIRSRLRLLAAALLAVALSLTLLAPAEAKPPRSYPDRIELPVGFRPEGITIGNKPVAYVGSLATGNIYAADLRTGEGRLISDEDPGVPAVGLKIDKKALLYVAGGPSGTARVVDSRTGEILTTYRLSTEPSFINDVVLTKRAAWFTNSLQPELYRVPLGGDEGVIPTVIPLTGEWEQAPGFNANGIALTPDGRALLVVNTATGTLYRVTSDGVATRVDLGGDELTNGDGLLVRGRTLYVVQNRTQPGGGGQAQPPRHRRQLGRHSGKRRVRRTNHGGRLQGQPLLAERPFQRPATPAGRRVLDHSDRPRELTQPWKLHPSPP